MKTLIIGAHGQLGHDLCEVFADCDLHRADRSGSGIALDLCDEARLRAVLDEVKPALVINTAATHNVPACEREPAGAFATNATAMMHLATACARVGARLVHISSDYVFGDGHTQPIPETALPAPLSVYGASKLAGEHLAMSNCGDTLVVRSAALYGKAPCLAKGGMNFVQLMLHLAATRPEIKVVTDEITTPTYTLALARQVRVLAERGKPGVYHATCIGQCSWHEFAQAIFAKTGTAANLQTATSADFPSPVRRPKYSALDNAHLRAQGLDIMPAWEDALDDYLKAQAATQP